jgi:hypothetical protein
MKFLPHTSYPRRTYNKDRAINGTQLIIHAAINSRQFNITVHTFGASLSPLIPLNSLKNYLGNIHLEDLDTQ